MKKFITIFLSAVMMFGLFGCGSPEEEQPEEQIDYEIAMVTDAGMIMDGGYSQVAWTAISEFGASKGVSHKYYKAAEASEDAYRETIDTAVSRGAKVIIADGTAFEDVVYQVQSQYEDVKFILIDGEPMDADSGETKISDNTLAILFSSEQAGYLAGYGAVKEGYTQLGFMGDAKESNIIDYGYGFLQGAEAASQEDGVQVSVNYHYCGSSEDRNQRLELATGWYEGGTEVIFACGSQLEQPVIEAAELTDREVIAFETDKSQMSDTILTSAVKDIATALETALEQYRDEEFPGGTTMIYDAANEGIRLELENGRLQNFTEAQYRDVFGGLAAGTTEVQDHAAGSIGGLGLSNVTVTEQ
ncbi:MAG: BMP family ABC transporter substrate-binding protein [Bacillota bacterium]|nr:BMP family ABC transporter substrate-binding protein [Bacillota bacterium]